MNRITEKDIIRLLNAINKLDENLWHYDYFANSGGYYFSRGNDNPVRWTNGRISPKEAYAFLSGILYDLRNCLVSS